MEILSLGEKIKRKRKELNMTLKDLAGDRITPGQISLVESGRSNPSMDLLEYLADALKTSVEYLMESEETQAEKICMYYEQVAEAYILSGDYFMGEKYIENGLYYSEKYNLEYRKARILFLTGKIHMLKDELVAAQQYFLSSNVIFIKNNNFEEVVKTFLCLGKITLKLKAYHSTSSYLKQAEKVYIDNNIGNDQLLGEIYYYMANSFFKTDNIKQSIDYAFLAKEKFQKIYNKKDYARTLLLLSDEYSESGDLINAIKYSKKALEVYQELEDISSIAEIENSLGRLFYEFENIEESFIHYNLAKGIRLSNNDEKLVNTLLNICENYLKIKDVEKCEEGIKEIYKHIRDDDHENRIECNLLQYRVNLIKDIQNEAENILIDTYKYAINNDCNKRAGQIAIMLGKFYMDSKREKEAAKYLDYGIDIFNSIGLLRN
ncbi:MULTISPECIES: helix-turn-helix transcriptional regulator [Clostridium]|uniref:TPR repeat-containing DNA binding protein n=2 Tax=Clostridium intestinale TaxID=36845 RepID=U2N2V6_9CLOT|nr:MULTISPECIES: helix-turn-helix transcriptional regulator [Clostridium]ERK29842.1 TPR repeat-containing DNA binding protein [Clostridium intestinale URNW]SHH93179.1 Tetratricopeptide repeat-containing protein [Clostridium intestinale DSM 6191]